MVHFYFSGLTINAVSCEEAVKDTLPNPSEDLLDNQNKTGKWIKYWFDSLSTIIYLQDVCLYNVSM